MGIIRILVLGAAAALVLPIVYKNLYPFIFPVYIYNHTPGPCRSVPGIAEGSEDMQLLPSGLALITTGIRFQTFDLSQPAFIGRKGHMKVVDLEHPEKGAEIVEMQDTTGTLDLEEFNPHGMSIWQDKKKGRVFVFVVNHHLPSNTEYITRFEWMDKTRTLKHLSSFTDSKMDLVNDVVATGENSFYYTNYLHHRGGRLVHWERLLRLKFGSVGYFDGTSTTIVLTGLLVPNGINISPDGKIVYLAEGGMQQLNTYTRHPDNSLELIESHVLHTSLDNIDVDDDGAHLWIGCHPYRPALATYIQDPRTNASPSQVLRVRVKGGHVTAVEEVLSDDGRLLSASTVAVYHQKTSRMLVGSIASTALYCDVNYLA